MQTYDTLFSIGGGIVITAGLTILLLALFKDRAKGRRRCPKCWYDMVGTPSLQCPECGKTAKAETKFLKTRRRWRWAVLACVLLVAGGGIAGTPKTRRDGPFALVPTPMLNFAASFFDKQAERIYLENFTAVYNRRATLGPWERVLFVRRCRIHLMRGLEDEIQGDQTQSEFNDPSRIMIAGAVFENEARLLKPALIKIIADREHLLEQAINDPNVDFHWEVPTPPDSGIGMSAFTGVPLAEEIFTCHQAMLTLGDIGAIDELIALGRGSPYVRAFSLFALGFWSDDQREWLEPLILALDDSRDVGSERGGGRVTVRDIAMDSLQWSAFTGEERINTIEEIAKDHPGLREQISAAISAITADMESGK